MGKKTSKKLKVKIFYTMLKNLNAMGQTLFETSLISRDIFEGLVNSTGCISDIWKKVQVNILKEPMLVLKQTIHQQKALDLTFNMAP